MKSFVGIITFKGKGIYSDNAIEILDELCRRFRNAWQSVSFETHDEKSIDVESDYLAPVQEVFTAAVGGFTSALISDDYNFMKENQINFDVVSFSREAY